PSLCGRAASLLNVVIYRQGAPYCAAAGVEMKIRARTDSAECAGQRCCPPSLRLRLGVKVQSRRPCASLHAILRRRWWPPLVLLPLREPPSGFPWSPLPFLDLRFLGSISPPPLRADPSLDTVRIAVQAASTICWTTIK